MNNDVELEGRPRPLSTGLWTLFSWLRRDDRTDSSDSLSSAGSDRTVASFAFLTPAHYPTATTPALLPPLGPPTDSYKKRVHDRNLRRQYDQGVTLHRKYGLLKSGDTGCGYDALSLPPVRRSIGESGSRWDRDRRATSECFQRRLAHVPGKRRAPLPPVHTVPNPLTSLTRRSTRKRRAPPPPVKVIENNKENLKNPEENTVVAQMNPNSFNDKQKLQNTDVSMGCKSEKYSKKEECIKNTKLKSEKSFLKQIFDKKRNSNIDVSNVKLLPSISELDKQAAEIIENNKLNSAEYNNNLKNVYLEPTTSKSSTKSENWICVTCLRKYNMSIVNCAYCISNRQGQSNDKGTTSKASNSYTQTETNLPNSTKNTLEEKQKLMQMLKEMKDSLPKRPKHDLNDHLKTKAVLVHTTPEKAENISCSTEMPTLRVGSNVESKSHAIFKTPQYPAPLSSRPLPRLTYSTTASQVTPNQKANQDISRKKTDTNKGNQSPNTIKKIEDAGVAKSGTKIFDQIKTKDLHTPLRISSLLNPIYISKQTIMKKPENSNVVFTELQPANQKIIGATSENIGLVSKHSGTTKASNIPTTSQTNQSPLSNNKVEIKSVIEKDLIVRQKPVISQNNNLPDLVKKNAVVERKNNYVLTTLPVKDQNIPKASNNVDHHMKRRDLINQLEQSIAKGDERAAAEAASKLAQLRLSCSVLSFSSQILSQPSTSTSSIETVADKIIPNASKEQLRREHLQLSSSKAIAPPQKVLVNKITLHSQSAGSSRINDTITPIQIPTKKSSAEAKKDDPTANQTMITIAVLVEDREATRGPIHLRINRQALMKDLRREAETTLGLPIKLQRWIVGRVLCVNDNAPVVSLVGPDFSAPFYLCVVESEKNAEQATQTEQKQILKDDKNKLQTKAGDVYTELIQLEQQALISNSENFECGVCMEEYPPGGGVVLRECVHIFCKDCLSDVVRHCGEPNVPCPATACRGMLQEREIRALVTPQDYERWLARGLAAAESGTRNAFHCRTKDCKGWALCEPGVQKFPCPVCKHINCIKCQDIHDGVTCEDHQAKLKQANGNANGTANDDGTRTLLNALIAKGEALECPECSAIITKKWGCDWVKCSACKTEICWVTRGKRWGPGGKGDTSGGCRCGVDGKRCHPSCGYCH